MSEGCWNKEDCAPERIEYLRPVTALVLAYRPFDRMRCIIALARRNRAIRRRSRMMCLEPQGGHSHTVVVNDVIRLLGL